LSDLRLWFWLQDGELAARFKHGVEHPETIDRFGAFCLGESQHLVNCLSLKRIPPSTLLFVVPGNTGSCVLSVWTDLNNKLTTLRSFDLQEHKSDCDLSNM
jgi:hypothetical protein